MDTTNFSSTNFGAKFINKIPVKKLDLLNNTYKDANVSFVQIEPNNRNDALALKYTARYWYNGHYADNIAYTARQIYTGAIDSNRYQVYALTKQKKHFNELSSDKILGLVEVENKPNFTEILHLQVDPELVYTIQPPTYKHVGTGILNSLKKFYKKSIELKSVYSAVKFYEKNGFKMSDPSKLRLRWEPSKK